MAAQHGRKAVTGVFRQCDISPKPTVPNALSFRDRHRWLRRRPQLPHRMAGVWSRLGPWPGQAGPFPLHGPAARPLRPRAPGHEEAEGRSRLQILSLRGLQRGHARMDHLQGSDRLENLCDGAPHPDGTTRRPPNGKGSGTGEGRGGTRHDTPYRLSAVPPTPTGSTNHKGSGGKGEGVEAKTTGAAGQGHHIRPVGGGPPGRLRVVGPWRALVSGPGGSRETLCGRRRPVLTRPMAARVQEAPMGSK